MKIIRIITLLITIPLLSSITYTSAIARDCSDPKGFHAKMMCKLSGSSSISKEKKSNPDSLWNKIKNFGGKNVGEAG
tara:strand:+ start:337 stop:567 length:231 start_codon:yes stop_codon:yes gene_type:complete